MHNNQHPNDKVSRVLDKNTFWYFDSTFEDENEVNIESMVNLLDILRNKIEMQNGVKEEFLNEILQMEQGLNAVLALNGVSFEILKRIITFARVRKSHSLDQLLRRNEWDDTQGKISEMDMGAVIRKVSKNDAFRYGLIALFFYGASNPDLKKVLPSFELSKFSIRRFSFEKNVMIDTLVRYKTKGSYNGKKANNPESLLEDILVELGLEFERGKDLPKFNTSEKRTMDFVIPNVDEPAIIIECSYLTTTSSGQGDKSKTEINVSRMIQQSYPQTRFIGFIDGIGWYVRINDLKRMSEAYEDVFTFHVDELKRFRKWVCEVMKID